MLSFLTKGKFKEDDTGDIISVDSSGTPTGRNVEAFFKNDFIILFGSILS